jgi:hypothetical protein
LERFKEMPPCAATFSLSQRDDYAHPELVLWLGLAAMCVFE